MEHTPLRPVELRTHRPFTQPLDYEARGDRRTTLERIADTLQSPRFLPFYWGWISGCFFTVAVALVWAQFQ